jgi:hypothetical protein
MAQVGKHLPRKHKVLSLNPGTAKKRRKEKARTNTNVPETLP